MYIQEQSKLRNKVILLARAWFLSESWFVLQALISLYVIHMSWSWKDVKDIVDIFELVNVVWLLFNCVILIIGGILYLKWFYTAYKNLELAGIKKQYSNKMVVWWYIIPIINLWYPLNIMKELFSKMNISLWNNIVIPAIFSQWWWLFIINNAAWSLSAKMPIETTEQIIRSAYVDILSGILGILYLWIFLKMFAVIWNTEKAFYDKVSLSGDALIWWTSSNSV